MSKLKVCYQNLNSCYFADKMIPTGLLRIHFQISSNTFFYNNTLYETLQSRSDREKRKEGGGIQRKERGKRDGKMVGERGEGEIEREKRGGKEMTLNRSCRLPGRAVETVLDPIAVPGIRRVKVGEPAAREVL